MKRLLSIAFIMFFCAANAQYGAVANHYSRQGEETSALMTDAMGQPFYPQTKYTWEGKVFFPDEYTYATLTTVRGKVYRNIRSKFNLVDNKLLFTDSAGGEFVVTVPLARVEFEDLITSKKFVFINPGKDTGTAMYQVLDSGKATLLKKIFITYKDQTPFGSTNVTRIFEQKFSYFIYTGESVLPLDRSKSALLDVMKDNGSKVDAFIEQEKLKTRKEEDLVKIFRFYNSLQ